MKKILISLISLALILTVVLPAWAQEATESSAPDPEQTTQELKERIQRIVEEKSEQIKGVIDQLSQTKRGFIGQVERVTEESLTIANSKGTEIIPVDQEVDLLKANQAISIDDVAVDDWVVVMGLVEDDVFVAKRILVSASNIRPKNHTVALGTIVDQNSTQITVLSRKNDEITFNLNTKTEFQDQDGQEVNGGEFIDDLQVLIVGYEDDDGKTAEVVRSLVLLEALQDND